jgi:hypothetical protein
LEAALDALGEGGDERAQAELCRWLAESHLFAGNAERAIEFAERGLPLAERHDLTELLAQTIGSKSVALFTLGRHREAAMLGRGAVMLAEQLGSQHARAEALLNLGVQVSEDDPKESLQLFLDAADMAKRAGQRGMEVINLANAVEAAIDIGRWDDADSVLAELQTRDVSPFIGAGIAFNAAMLAALRGDITTATGHLDEVASRMEGTEMVAERTWHLRSRSVVNLAKGDLEGAYTDAMSAVAADPAGMNAPLAVWVAARAALWLRDPSKVRSAIDAMAPLRGRWIEVAQQSAEAGLAALEGKIDEGSAGYRRAFESWAAMELPLDLALTAMDAVLLLPEDAVPDGAARRAKDTLTRLGAQPLLARLTAAEQPATAGT